LLLCAESGITRTIQVDNFHCVPCDLIAPAEIFVSVSVMAQVYFTHYRHYATERYVFFLSVVIVVEVSI